MRYIENSFLAIFLSLSVSVFSATYTVTNTNNSGAGSLRQAIADANTLTPGINDLIVFNLGAGGPYTISLTSPLILTDNAGVTIDGFSQSGSSANTIAVFNASAATPMNAVYQVILSGGAVSTGITISSSNNVIKGMAIPDIGNPAISITSGSGNQIVGCYIGTTAAGNVAGGPNLFWGIYVASNNNTIGDGTAAGANLISTNDVSGVYLDGSSNTIKGNMIGLAKDGSTFITPSSQDFGVYINGSATLNTIGGSGAGEGNVISGNSVNAGSGRGIFIISSTGANTVLGNIIGPRADGLTNVTGNGQDYGIAIINSPNNIIGGNSIGARNIISANLTYGIDIQGASSTGNSIKGNYMGIAKDGITFIAGSGQKSGIRVALGATLNTIGGAGIGEGNVISGQKYAGEGIYISGATSSSNTIVGNIIGPQADGSSMVVGSTQAAGVTINSPNNIIGGNSVGARNIISANGSVGITLYLASATGNIIKGNYIGIASDGATFILPSAQNWGVRINSGSSANIIGGTGVGEGNVISGQQNPSLAQYPGTGIFIEGGPGSHTIVGNIIGPQANGISNVTGNKQFYGICMINQNSSSGAANNVIGGNSLGARNIISANLVYGIYIDGATSTGNVIKGNMIGPGSTGLSIAGSSQSYGVYIAESIAAPLGSSSNNFIGGYSSSGDANTIAYNTTAGVYIFTLGATGNLISRNPIFSNGPKAINLNYGANEGNGGKAPPVFSTVTTTSVSGTNASTAGVGDSVEVFKNTTGSCQDAVSYLGTVEANAAGNWTLTGLTINPGETVLATARTLSDNNTSEFACMMLVCGTAPIITGNTNICQGTSTTLTVSGGTNYLWSNGNTSSILTTNITANTNYTVTATDAIGCINTASVTVNVNALPNATISGNTSNCQGTGTTLTASGGTSYFWNTGTTANTITVNPTTNSIYSVTVSDVNGCSSVSSTLISLNTATITITGPSSVCSGNNTSLSVTGANSYVWSTGNTGSSISFSPTISDTYTVTGTDANGCSGSAQLSVAVDQPVMLVVSNDTSICQGQSIILSASGSASGIYNWNTGNTTASLNVTPTSDASYTVTASSASGACNDIKSITVVVLPGPTVDAGNDITITTGNSTILSGSTSGGGSSWQWIPASGLSCDTCQNPSASPQQTTTYYLTVTDANGCTSKDSVIITVDIVCGDIYIPTAFSPNNDGQNDEFKVEGNCITELQLTIYNRWGEIVFQTSDKNKTWNGVYKGKSVDVGVFAYQLAATLTTSEAITKKGNISLVR